MSKKKHDQRGRADPFVCEGCQYGVCERCIDVLRSIYSKELICKCKRKNHMGEPRDQQILDPETNAVHAPGMIIHEDGEVERT